MLKSNKFGLLLTKGSQDRVFPTESTAYGPEPDPILRWPQIFFNLVH